MAPGSAEAAVGAFQRPHVDTNRELPDAAGCETSQSLYGRLPGGDHLAKL